MSIRNHSWFPFTVYGSASSAPHPTSLTYWSWGILNDSVHGLSCRVSISSLFRYKFFPQFLNRVHRVMQLLLLRTIGILLPIYVMVKAFSAVQHRRRQSVSNCMLSFQKLSLTYKNPISWCWRFVCTRFLLWQRFSTRIKIHPCPLMQGSFSLEERLIFCRKNHISKQCCLTEQTIAVYYRIMCI